MWSQTWPNCGCRRIHGAREVSADPPTGPVLLFDGECGLCNRVVRLAAALDREGKLRFAPLQGPSAQAYLRAHGLPTADFEHAGVRAGLAAPRTPGASCCARTGDRGAAGGGPGAGRWLPALVARFGCKRGATRSSAPGAFPLPEWAARWRPRPLRPAGMARIGAVLRADLPFDFPP